MCGIAGILLKNKSNISLREKITGLSSAISHRGPDGEGFITATESKVTPHFSPQFPDYGRLDLNYLPSSPLEDEPAAFLAFAHRRLSILDLSASGHQPMCSPDGNLWITYNGEIYNYIELRNELKQAGHRFFSESDTEVILAAYAQWGAACVEKFNGMWAFCIYDVVKKQCFASRDRFGVKPFYYIDSPAFFCFASEQKAFVKAGLIQAKASRKAVHTYLLSNLLETQPDNFFEGITELWPGHNLVYDVQRGVITTSSWFHLKDYINLENDSLSDKALIEKVSATFENAVKLRLRSDVEVGTCLSGGLDSSALAVTIAGITGQPLNCFTSVFRNEAFNEERYADSVAKKINARHFKTEPGFDDFLREADQLIYSQDVPIWSTSTYAQYKVMELASKNKIKVVLDGQGADELFGGYHHHHVAYWNNLLANGRIIVAVSEISAARKSIPNPFIFYLKERLKQKKQFNLKEFRVLFKNDFISGGDIVNPNVYFDNLNDQLVNDIYETRLKSFLKCEDRAGMWHGVESRTPFSDDIELIRLSFSINGNRKIKQGVSKYLLREAVKSKLPDEIYRRYDKTGFETPMDKWIGKMRPTLLEEIKNAGFDFINPGSVDKLNPSNSFHNKLLFKLFVLARWKKLFGAGV